MPKLYLRMLTDATPIPDEEGFDLRVAWLVSENDGSIRGHGVTDHRGLQDVADPNVEWLQDPLNTIIFVPAHFVLQIACEVPGRSTLQIRRALPFAVEEYVAQDIESMAIAHGPIKAGSPIQCTIIAREQMENWLECLSSVGVKAGFLINDSELLPSSASSGCLLFEENTVLVAHMTQAAVIDRSNLGLALAGLDIDHVTVVGGELTDIEAGQAKNKLEAETIELDESGVLGYLASQFRDAAVGGTFINILQGEYQADRARSQAFSRWPSVIGLAAIWLVIAFLSMVAQGYWAEGQTEQLEVDSFAFYKEVFPRESQPVSVDQLRRRMASKLGKKSTGGSESAFVGLVSQFANVLDPTHLVSSISYAEQRRELNVEVLLKDYDEIDSLKDKLASSWVIMEPTNAEQEDNQVRSRMKLRYDY